MLGVLCVARRLRLQPHVAGEHMLYVLLSQQLPLLKSQHLLSQSPALSTTAHTTHDSPLSSETPTTTHSESPLPSTIPVAIVGAGPTGLTMSMLLSKLHIPHVVFDARQGLTQHPQAHYINYRTMEVLRYV